MQDKILKRQYRMGKYTVCYLKQFTIFKNCKHSINICILSLPSKIRKPGAGIFTRLPSAQALQQMSPLRVMYCFQCSCYPVVGQLHHLCCLLIPLRHLICDSCSKPNSKGACKFDWKAILQR